MNSQSDPGDPRDLRARELEAAYAAAAADPAFMARMRSTTETYEPTVADGLRPGTARPVDEQPGGQETR